MFKDGFKPSFYLIFVFFLHTSDKLKERNWKYPVKGNYMLFCPSCGKPTTPNTQSNSSNVVVKTEKSPILAAILSFLIVGVGQIYLGLTKKGIILFFAAMVSGVLTLLLIGWILWLIVWLYSIYDAYNSANKINAGISVEDTIDFNNL